MWLCLARRFSSADLQYFLPFHSCRGSGKNDIILHLFRRDWRLYLLEESGEGMLWHMSVKSILWIKL